MSLGGSTIAVVVPSHNEERFIGRVLGGMPRFVDDVIVVDDGSNDDTADRVREAADSRVTLISHPSQRGVGAAIRTGYRKAIELGAEAAAVMPGDAQADPHDLDALLTPLLERRCDYSKGNRLFSPDLYALMPPLRLWGNRLLGILTRIAVGRADISDPQCGYTAISRQALTELLSLPFCDGYGYPNEILCNLVRLRKRILDVPVRAVYADEDSGICIPLYALKMSFILTRCMARRAACSLRRRASGH